MVALEGILEIRTVQLAKDAKKKTHQKLTSENLEGCLQ